MPRGFQRNKINDFGEYEHVPEKNFELCLRCKNYKCIGYNYLKPEHCFNKDLSADDLEDALDMLAIGQSPKKVLQTIGIDSILKFKNKIKKSGYEIEKIFESSKKKYSLKLNEEWKNNRLMEIENGI